MSKKEKKNGKAEKKTASSAESLSLSTSKDLRDFLLNIRDRLGESQAAIINAVSAMNHILNHPDIYELLDKESKEIARDIWLRIKQAGVQLRNPPLLFEADEAVGDRV